MEKAQKPQKRGHGPGRRITKENAREMQKRAQSAKELRKKVRQELLQAVVDEGITTHIVKAIHSKDLNYITVIEKAMKLVGLDYAGTEGLLAHFEAKSTGDDKKPQSTTVKFVLAKKPVEE